MNRSKGTALVLTIILAFGTATPAFADTASAETVPVPKKIYVYLKPDLTVKIGEDEVSFYNVNKLPVYPIIYQGSTYLPVRAISEIMGEEIEWDGIVKTVYIGKTISKPNKSSVRKPTGEAVKPANQNAFKPEPQLVEVDFKPDITIMYDFAPQSFTDVNGDPVYPIIYQGTTYLPIRAISGLMGEEIEWDNPTKTITIGNMRAGQAEAEKNERVEMLRNTFSEAVDLHDEATAKIVNIQKSQTKEELVSLANAVSEDCLKASQMTTKIKSTNQKGFSDEEKAACDDLIAFVEISELYILVLENIAYMAAEGQDYSILAETFLNFAMESQTKMDAARRSIEAL